MKTSRILVVVVLPALVSTAALAQSPKFPLVMLTLNTGTVLVAEVKYESPTELKVFNLDTRQEESYPKGEKFARKTAAEAKLLPGNAAVSRERPQRLEAVLVRELSGAPPEVFSRLGRYPENAAAYLAWAAERLVPHAGGKPGTLAVLPLQETQGQSNGETTRRTEELTNALGRRQVALVERGQFDRVLGELHLEQGRTFDTESAQKVGRQLGAQAVVIGTLVPRGRVVDLNLRLVETETGRVLDTPTVTNVPKTAAGATIRKASPSLAGQWLLKLPTGQTREYTFLGNSSFASEGGMKGSWRQSGLKVAMVARAPVRPGSRELGPPVRWQGELEEGGERFTITNDKGDVVTAERK